MRTRAIVVALLVCLSAPQLGCASVAKQESGSAEGAIAAVKAKEKKEAKWRKGFANLWNQDRGEERIRRQGPEVR